MGESKKMRETEGQEEPNRPEAQGPDRSQQWALCVLSLCKVMHHAKETLYFFHSLSVFLIMKIAHAFQEQFKRDTHACKS